MASVSGALWESLFDVYMVIALLVGGAVIGWLLYAMWRFRWRPGEPRPVDAPRAGVIPAERGHVLWTYVMAGTIAAILFGLAFSTISAIETLEHPPEDEEALHVDVIGFQFGWRYIYEGSGGIPVQRVTEFYVPVDTVVTLNITSSDVWHNFAIPDYRIRIDAIPGTTNHLWFKATETAETHSVCVVICGAGHANMRTAMHVVTADEFAQWLDEQSAAEYEKYLKNARNARANVTFDGAQLSVAEANVTASKAVVFSVTNTATAAADVAVQDEAGETLSTVTVPPGGTRHVYALAPEEGDLVLAAGGAIRTIEVS